MDWMTDDQVEEELAVGRCERQERERQSRMQRARDEAEWLRREEMSFMARELEDGIAPSPWTYAMLAREHTQGGHPVGSDRRCPVCTGDA